MPARPLPPTKVDPKVIDEATMDLAEAKKEQKEANDAVAEVQDGLLGLLGAEKLSAWNVDRVTATVVTGERISIDEVMLRKKIGAAAYRKLCSLALDKKLLEDAMASGDIDPNVVAACTTLTSNKPYIRLTERAATVADTYRQKKGGDR